MKKAGVIILFNPNIKEIRKNILSYVAFLDKLYVIDNSSVSNEKDVVDISSKIQYVANLENQGISIVLNVAASKAIEENYDILLTMDQDSFFPEFMIRKYVNFVDELDWSNTSLIGASPKSNIDNQIIHSDTTLTSAELLITSGSFINLKLFNIIGGFNEKLFIDCVDYDYCLRSIIKGYSVGIASNIIFLHVGGEPRKFMGKKVAIYSPDRYYYIFRNHIFLWFKYIKYFPKLIVKNIIVNILISLLPNIILSKSKIKFISSLVRAVKDAPSIF